MPTVEVFRDTDLIQISTFHSQFMILEKGQHLVWEADDNLTKLGGGEIHIWILLKPDDRYYISYVRPDWSLMIDGMKHERKLYQNILINNQVIELGYRNYHFICK